MISTVLEHVTIVDGSGQPRFSTDVAFVENRIAIVGDCSDREARRRVDCRGKCVAPGFIDACSHTGEKWLTSFDARSKTGQGVVAEVTALFSKTPANHWEKGPQFDEALDLALRTKHATAGSFLVEQHVQASIERGASGVWIDLRTTTLDEAVKLAREAAFAGAPRALVTLRDHGAEVVDAVDDAILLAERATVHVHIANHHAVYPRNTGRMERTLERIDHARTRGLSISCDVAPYTATWIELSSLLPPNITPAQLTDDVLAAAVSLEMQARLGDIWHDLMLAEVGSEERMAWCGMRFDEIAKQSWRTPSRTVVDFIAQEGNAARAFLFCLKEADVATLLSADFCAIGTSASSYSGQETPFGVIHPRAFGTFPRVFGRFVRQRRTIDVEEAVRRMTSLPADVFGLRDRGRIVEGAHADVVVFDEKTFVDTATYERPFSLPVGLTHVFRDGAELNVAGGVA